MKRVSVLFMTVMLGAVTAQAGMYYDTVDAGGGDMDITQVEVTHDALSINFSVSFDAAGIGTDINKHFGVMFDTVAGGDTGANAWDYQPYMSSGMDYFSAAWSDGAGSFEMNTYSEVLGGWPEWDNGNNDTWVEWTAPGVAGNTVSFSVSRAALGVTGSNDSFDFDVLTWWAGGTWTADGLGAEVGGLASYDSSTLGYNTYAIPEPASVLLLVLGSAGLYVTRRSIRS